MKPVVGNDLVVLVANRLGNTVRNIIVSPEAGMSADGVFDPSPWAFALTSRLIAESDSWNLPRKFKIAFSNSSADTAYAQFNDVGFVATIHDQREGFKVYVAGGLGAKSAVGHRLHDFVSAEDVYRVTTDLKRLFDKHGTRFRAASTAALPVSRGKMALAPQSSRLFGPSKST